MTFTDERLAGSVNIPQPFLQPCPGISRQRPLRLSDLSTKSHWPSITINERAVASTFNLTLHQLQRSSAAPLAHALREAVTPACYHPGAGAASGRPHSVMVCGHHPGHTGER